MRRRRNNIHDIAERYHEARSQQLSAHQYLTDFLDMCSDHEIIPERALRDTLVSRADMQHQRYLRDIDNQYINSTIDHFEEQDNE